MSEHAIDLAAAPDRAWAAVSRAAELWGGELERRGEGGRLRLPVRAGLRRGWAGGEVEVAPLPEGSRLGFRVDEGESRVQAPLLVILLLGALGGLLAAAWPFAPRLLAAAPVGVVLALAAWFLVASRLRTSGPEEFLDTVAALIGEENAGAVNS